MKTVGLLPRLLGWSLPVFWLFQGAIALSQTTYEPYAFSTFAGNPPGAVDGVGQSARFDGPFGTAVDSSGNLYVADAYNNTIRKITPGGFVFTLAGLAGSEGSDDGETSAARFYGAKGLAVDATGNLYVADSGNDTIRRISPEGGVTTIAGAAGVPGSTDGPGELARFNFPTAIAVDAQGNLYIADTANNTIRALTPEGVVSTLAGLAGAHGSKDGTGSEARFKAPSGIAVDTGGNLYVADAGNETIRIITPGGVVSTLAGAAGSVGSTDGTGSEARFDVPFGIAVDNAGNLYVADTFNHTIRKITPGGLVTTLAGLANEEIGGGGSADGTGSGARFNKPRCVAVDSSGILYVADTHNNTIRRVTPAAVVTTIAGLAGTGSTDGTGRAARLSRPNGLALDPAGDLFVADSHNNTIRKITPAGVVTTIAGTAGTTGSDDGNGAAARFNFPRGIAVGAMGNIYVSDGLNDTIRKITPAGNVTTFAGLPGAVGSDDGLGSEARFNQPFGIAVDEEETVYVADAKNDTIRKITPAGLVSTLAGSPLKAGFADGTGSDARFNQPAGIVLDDAGNLYVADHFNHTIRMITPAAVVSTIAGTAAVKGNADGNGTAAHFFRPTGICLDQAGNLYIGDSNNNLIRKISPTRDVTTLAGLVGRRGGRDGAGSDSHFFEPLGVAVNSAGDLYVADNVNDTVRVGTAAPPVIRSPLSATAMVGAEFAYQFSANGASSLAVSGLPAGLSFDPSLSTIVGTPVAAGTSSILLSATNSLGTTTAILTLAVQDVLSSTPTIVSGTGVTGGIGRAFSYQIKASGVSGDAAISATGLPAGLMLDSNTGLISGTLANQLMIDNSIDLVTSAPAPDGSAQINLTLKDEKKSTLSTLQLTFTSDPGIPVIVSSNQASGTQGQPFSYKIVADNTSDPEAGDTSYSYKGTLPPGLQFDPVTGTISGLYNVQPSAPGKPVWKSLTAGPLDVVGSVQLFAKNRKGTGSIPLLFVNAPPGASNMSTRLDVGAGDDVLIGGFIVTGEAPKKLLLRAMGPSLQVNGVPIAGTLQDTELELYSDGVLLASNDDWRESQELEISATGLSPPNDHEAALIMALDPGEYTAIVRGKSGATGVALIEAYDLGTASLEVSQSTQLANLSTRGKVEPGDNVLIGGFIVSGNTQSTVLLRALGPELANSGVAGVLADPILELRDANAVLLAFNDDWTNDQESQILFTDIAPIDARESAILRSLGPGSYLAVVRGKNDSSGIALFEAYFLK